MTKMGINIPLNQFHKSVNWNTGLWGAEGGLSFKGSVFFFVFFAGAVGYLSKNIAVLKDERT